MPAPSLCHTFPGYSVWVASLTHFNHPVPLREVPAVLPPQAESREHIVAFNMLNYRSCKNLWKSCVEHHSFFQAKKLLPQEKNVLSQYWTLGSRNPKK